MVSLKPVDLDFWLGPKIASILPLPSVSNFVFLRVLCGSAAFRSRRCRRLRAITAILTSDSALRLPQYFPLPSISNLVPFVVKRFSDHGDYPITDAARRKIAAPQPVILKERPFLPRMKDPNRRSHLLCAPPLPTCHSTPFHPTHTPCHPIPPQACDIAYPTSPQDLSWFPYLHAAVVESFANPNDRLRPICQWQTGRKTPKTRNATVSRCGYFKIHRCYSNGPHL